MSICDSSTRFANGSEFGRLSEVPVVIATDLSPEQIKAYRIADNKTGELADWDFDVLPIELADLRDASFDLELTGFESTELERLLGDCETPDFGPASEDDQGQLDQKTAITCPHCHQEFIPE